MAQLLLARGAATMSPSSVMRTLIASALAATVTVGSTMAAITVPIPLPALVRRADLIIDARVIGRPVTVKLPNGLPVQRVSLAVIGEPLWGKSDPHFTWTTLADTAPNIAPDSRLVLFLTKPDADGLRGTIGPGGLFVVETRKCERLACEMALNGLNNEGLWTRTLWQELSTAAEPSKAEWWGIKQRFEGILYKNINDPDVLSRVILFAHTSTSRGPIPLELIRETVGFVTRR